MRRLSSLATLMVVIAYCATLLGLVINALDPLVDWTLGFLTLLLFFCVATEPVIRLVGRHIEPNGHSPRLEDGSRTA